MTCLLHKAAFQQSAEKLTQLPADSLCEVAFAGRSNAGKSSALNALTGRRRLAHVSKTPGRTRLINFFAVGTSNYLQPSIAGDVADGIVEYAARHGYPRIRDLVGALEFPGR